MGFLRALRKTAVDVVLTPVSIVQDIATLGGTLKDGRNDESYTGERLRKLGEDIEELRE